MVPLVPTSSCTIHFPIAPLGPLLLGGLSEGFVSENFSHRLGAYATVAVTWRRCGWDHRVSFKFRNETRRPLIGGGWGSNFVFRARARGLCNWHEDC